MKTPPAKSIALLASTVAIALSSLAATPATARSEDDLTRLSHRLEDLSSELREEFRAHYRHTSIYRHLVEDAVQIEKESDHIHGLAHDCRASLRHIEADLAELDELAHHLHELVDKTETGRYGHVHGDTRHVHELLEAVNGVIHDMQDVVEDVRRGDHRHDSRGHRYGHSYHDEDRYSSGRRGFSISIRR